MQSTTATAARVSPRQPRRLVAPLLAWCGRAVERQRQRRDLAQLSDASLADLGLSRAEALAEARRPFWD